MRTASHLTANKSANDPPIRPTARTMFNIGKNTETVAYFLKGDKQKTESGDPFNEKENQRLDFLSHGQMAVAIGPLSIRHHKVYETIHGESINKAVARIITVLSFVHGMRQDPPVFVPNVEVDEFLNFTTQFGVLYGSPEIAMADLFAYIASRRGRVTGYDENGEYTFEEMSDEDILDCLDFNDLFTVEGETDLFYEALRLANLYDPEAAEAALKAEGMKDRDLQDDEGGNSRGKSGDDK